MKKCISALIALAVFGSANGQNVIENDNNSSNNASNGSNVVSSELSQTSEPNLSENIDDFQKLQSSFGIEYSAVEDGGAVGMEFVINHFLLAGAMGWGKETDYIKDQSTWQLEIGGNHRYFLGTKYLYLEGRAMIGYAHMSYQYMAGTETKTNTVGTGKRSYTSTYTVTKWEKDSDGDFYLGVSPRIGLNLIQLKNGNCVSIVAGYRWNFTKFKFDKEHTSDYFTIGINAVM